MPEKPQRPFVPHRTPNITRPTVTASEFRLYTPFVPTGGQDIEEPVARAASGGVVETQAALSVSLRPIEEFLDTSPVAAPGYPEDTGESTYEGAFEDEPDELPPVEHFIDSLPVVEDFAPDSEGARSGNGATSGEHVPTGAQPPDQAESGWGETDWQGFDWRAAAALGETANNEASNAWATTDWDATASKARVRRPTAAHAIATALDEIAQRIRDGELTIPGRGTMADPATIAATLAALLGVKR